MDQTHQILTLSRDGTYLYGKGAHGWRAVLSEDGSGAAIVNSIPQNEALFWCPSPRDEAPPEWLAQFLEDYSGCTLEEDGTITRRPASLRLRKFESEAGVGEIPRTWTELRDLFEPAN